MSHDVQQVRAFEHPGEGRKRAKSTPKGRQVDPQAAEAIELLLGDTAHLFSGFLPPCGKRAEHQMGERQVDDQPDGDADFHMDD